MKTAVLLVNVGTPDSPDVRDVRKFLALFLNDPHVINIPWLWRKILVNWMIVPFRAPKSAAEYRRLWTKDGSPLRIHSEKVRDLLQKRLAGQADVRLAMNYGNPDMAGVMNEMSRNGYDRLTVVPLFPQYADSTAGSAGAAVAKHLARWSKQPEYRIVKQFYDHPRFLDAWTERIASCRPEHDRCVVFSFHGLPLGHLPEKCRREGPCECLSRPDTPSASESCYKAACYDMARKLADRLGLAADRYTVAFQSRMSRRWMQPFTDDVLKHLARKGAKVLMAAPSFIADCLETTVELGIEYKETFLEHGGKDYILAESLNDDPKWIDALAEICQAAASED